jgi:ABC-type transporter Mla subunit MlaD
MSKSEDSNRLGPTYALRAWLTVLLGQLERARKELDTLLEYHEKEIARVRAQMQRGETVIGALREAIGTVDSVLRRNRDIDRERERAQIETPSPEQSKELGKTEKSEERSRRSKSEQS